MIKNPKGSGAVAAIFTVIIYAVIVIVAPWTAPTLLTIGVDALLFGGSFALDAGSCDINVYWGCDDNGSNGGGGSYQAAVGDACSSPANACGMTNTGFVVNNGDGTGSCNATIPPNSSCPMPTITDSGFYSDRSTVGTEQPTTLHWDAGNSTRCHIEGDNGFSHTGDGSGEVSTGNLPETTIFTLTCQNGAGGPTTSSSLKIIVDARYKEV